MALGSVPCTKFAWTVESLLICYPQNRMVQAGPRVILLHINFSPFTFTATTIGELWHMEHVDSKYYSKVGLAVANRVIRKGKKKIN